MKNILVPTDFSNDAYSALYYATQLFASNECTFYLLNVFDELTPLEGEKNVLIGNKKRLDKVRKEADEKLTATVHKIVLDDNNPRHRFETEAEKGNFVKTVNRLVKEHGIDLVVMGSKGHTGAKEIFLGSNTIQVAQAMKKCAVFAIPKQIDFKKPKEIAFITDFKKGCIKETLEPLLFLANISEASVRVMHITEEAILSKEQESHRKLLEICLKDVDHSYHWVGKYDDRAMVIDEFLKKRNIDMFTMVQQKHHFFERLVREPVIKDVSIYTDIPFLIIPSRN